MAPSAVETLLHSEAQQPKKIHILVASVPIFGHFENMRAIAAFLVSQSYKVSFLCATSFRSQAEACGATFVPLEGKANFDWDRRDEFATHRDASFDSLSGPEKMSADFSSFFLAQMAGQYWALQKFLVQAYAAHPEESVIMLQDLCFMGAFPPLMGAPGFKPAGLISMGIAPLMLTSVDTAPFGLGLAPDSSPEGRSRSALLNAHSQQQTFAASQAALVSGLKDLGAPDPSLYLFDMMVLKPDLFLQMTIPELEYARSDAPKSLRFIGALPPGRRESIPEYPPWWDEIVAHKKKLVVVTQGTASTDPSDLIIPTLSALSSSPSLTNEILVVATLVRGEAIPGSFDPPPPNVRLAKWLPFDDLFKHADVVVTNGGYGTVQQSLVAGVPLVLAGGSEDKPEACARVAATGAAIDLKTQTPTVEMVREAVERVLRIGGAGEGPEAAAAQMMKNNKKKNMGAELSSWAERARELKGIYARFDSLNKIIGAVEELALKNNTTRNTSDRKEEEEEERASL